MLGGQRVEPGEAVRAGDPQHVAVGEVDEAVAGVERALLAVERAVVGGDARVDALGGHGAGQVEEGTGQRHEAHVPKTVRWPTSAVKP